MTLLIGNVYYNIMVYKNGQGIKFLNIEESANTLYSTVI
jgi:hypothetical protein